MSVALSAALALTSCSATPPVLRPKWTPTWQMNRSTCTFPDGNHSGFDNAERAAVEARYGLVTFGWESRVCINAQRSADPTDRCANARAEAGLDAQAARIKALNPQTRVFLYRNTELGLSPYEDQCTKMYDPRYAGYWLRNTTSGAPFNEAAHVGQFLPCLQNTTNLVQDQYFRDFRNASSALDFVDNVVGSVTRSANADGVWFDDASGCCAEHGDLTEAFSAAELAALRNATAATLLKAEQALIAAGKWSDHLFVTIPRATKAGDHCVSAIEAGAALGAADAPGHMLIGYDACPACTPPYANSTDDFKRHLATFLIGRGKYSWMGHSWIATRPPLWYAEWDFDYGLPLGPMARAGSVFTRRFSTVDVSVDCDTLDSKFAWKTDEQPPKNCGAVIEEKLAPCESRTWRWTIRSSYNGNGPTAGVRRRVGLDERQRMDRDREIALERPRLQPAQGGQRKLLERGPAWRSEARCPLDGHDQDLVSDHAHDVSVLDLLRWQRAEGLFGRVPQGHRVDHSGHDGTRGLQPAGLQLPASTSAVPTSSCAITSAPGRPHEDRHRPLRQQLSSRSRFCDTKRIFGRHIRHHVE